jgi:hypothetical protein
MEAMLFERTARPGLPSGLVAHRRMHLMVNYYGLLGGTARMLTIVSF